MTKPPTKTVKKEPRRVRLTSLADLPVVKTTLTITHADDPDEVYVIELNELTFHKYWECEWKFPDPNPPLSGYKVDGTAYYNVEDGAFKAEKQRIEVKRDYLRCLYMVGEDAVPGNTVEEKLDYIEHKLPLGITQQLNRAQQELARKWKAAVDRQKATFQQSPTNGDADMPTDAVDTERVDGTI